MTGSNLQSEEHRFGSSRSLSLGVEEELLLVDDRHRLRPDSEAVLEALGAEWRDRVSTEIFATQIELKTGICDDSAQAARELRELRGLILDRGFGLLGAGLHPDDDEEHPALVDSPRYEIVKDDLASLLRTPPCGLHVHIGMPDAETAIRVVNALRHHLPLLQALTANSPFRQGEDTGLASARAAVVGAYPRFQMPRSFEDYEDFLRVADQLIAAAGVDDYTYLWWDLRPHPKLGTVEVRGMDVQADVADNAAVGALIQALAAREIDNPTEGRGLSREALEESYFQAGRHGLEARLMTGGESTAPAREVATQVLDDLRPYAERLGGEEALERIGEIVRGGNGADVQRRVHDQGGIGGVLEDLARRTSVV